MFGALLALAGCSQEPPPLPPAELVSTTGEVQLLRLWSSNIGESGRGLFEPLALDDVIIAANREGRITALAKDSGLRRWRSELGVRLISGVGGNAERIFVSDKNAIVHALDPASGDQIWQAQASSEVLMPVVAGFEAAVVRSADGRVVVLELDDGSERWIQSETPPALTLNGYSRPLLVSGGLLMGLDDGRVVALELATGRLIWETVLSVPSGRSEIERLVDIDADIAIDNEGIYVANYQGRAARLEPARGQIVWSSAMSAGAGIALNDSGLIVVNEDNSVIKLDKETGQEVWRNDSMPGRHLSPPAFTPQGDIVVGDVEGYVHVLDKDSGESLGRARPSKKAIIARPLIVEETMYLQASDGVVAAYRFSR